jgi:hypothetical protein
MSMQGRPGNLTTWLYLSFMYFSIEILDATVPFLTSKRKFESGPKPWIFLRNPPVFVFISRPLEEEKQN